MIEIKNLVAGYENKNVLNIDSMVFNEGEITAIVGLNGSGKSTLLKSIIGLTQFEGKIFLNKKEIKKLNHKDRAKNISYLPQINANGTMDVKTLVSHGRYAHLGFSKVLGAKDLELVENALYLCDLWEKKDKLISEISGGEKQRAYFAMVIAQNTNTILLDEPANYLDIEHQLKIMEMLKSLKAQGKGIIFTSHDLPQSFSICDKIYLLKNGQVVASGSPSEIVKKDGLVKKVMNVDLKEDFSEDSLYSYRLVR